MARDQCIDPNELCSKGLGVERVRDTDDNVAALRLAQSLGLGIDGVRGTRERRTRDQVRAQRGFQRLIHGTHDADLDFVVECGVIFAILPGAIERLGDTRAPYAARRLRVRAEHGEGRAGGAVAGHGAELVRAVAPVVVARRGRVVAVCIEGVHELGDALALAHGGKGLPVEGIARIEQKIGGAALGAIENRQSVKAHSAGALACVVAVLVAAVDIVGVHDGHGAVNSGGQVPRESEAWDACERAGKQRGG